MDDSKYNERKLQYFKEEGHFVIYFGICLSLAFLGYTYFQYFKLGKLIWLDHLTVSNSTHLRLLKGFTKLR